MYASPQYTDDADDDADDDDDNDDDIHIPMHADTLARGGPQNLNKCKLF